MVLAVGHTPSSLYVDSGIKYSSGTRRPKHEWSHLEELTLQAKLAAKGRAKTKHILKQDKPCRIVYHFTPTIKPEFRGRNGNRIRIGISCPALSAISRISMSALKTLTSESDRKEIGGKLVFASTEQPREFEEIARIAPGILNPKTPIRDSFLALPEMPKVKRGMSAVVRFMRLKDDPIGRIFALKKPRFSFAEMIGAGTSESRNLAALKRYRNNILVANAIGHHENFMKVCGVFIKDRKNGTESRPYLILEHIDGTILRDLPDCTLSRKLDLLRQLEKAFAHLIKNNILPRDLNFGNILVTVGNKPVIIDYDEWEANSSISSEALKNELNRKMDAIRRFLGIE